MKAARSTLAVVALAGGAALTAGMTRAAAPVAGTIAGPVMSVQGQSFTLRSSLSPTGKSKVHVGSSTAITEQATGARAALKKGVCVSAVGQKGKNGVVQASRLTLSAPVKGNCQTGFGRRQGSGPPPSGARRPPQGSPQGRFPANFGFAGGAINAVSGSVVTVRNQQGSTKVALSSKTQISRLVRVTMSAVKVGLCTFVQGTSTDKGVNVTARSISLFKPGANGCTMGRQRR